MPTLASVRETSTIPRVLALCSIFLSACTSQEVLRPYEYKTAHSDDIDITTKSGRAYELKAPWMSDALGNISGTGRVFVDGEWSLFEGNISHMEIEEVSVSKFDASNPAVIYGVVLGVGVVALIILTVSGAWWGGMWYTSDTP